MIKRVIYTFLALQFISFAFFAGAKTWNNHNSNIPNNTVTQQDIAESHEAPQYFENVRFVAKNDEKQLSYLSSDTKDKITSVLKKLPEQHFSTLQSLVLDYSKEAYRGLGGKNIIILRAVDINPSEFIAVLVHEIGHTVDLGYLIESDTAVKSEFSDNGKPVYANDLSLNFYRISWDNEKSIKKDAGNLDFVSGYALTDPFEDFAETYVYYVLHNKDFKSKTETNEKLSQKYDFMKNTVFNGKEFNTGGDLPNNTNTRPWDITLMSYDLQGFLNN